MSRLARLNFAGSLLGVSGGAPPRSNVSDAQLAAINARPSVLEPLTAEQVMVRSMDMISTDPLKNYLRLSAQAVRDIAGMAVGTPIQCNHDTYSGPDGLPVGVMFAATAAERDGATWALGDAYFPRTAPVEELVARVDAGAIKEVSVSFMPTAVTCSICKTELSECSHWPGETYDGQTAYGDVAGAEEYYETSLVWAGMANNTRLRMAASLGREDLAAMFPRKPRAAEYLARALAPHPVFARFVSGQQKVSRA